MAKEEKLNYVLQNNESGEVQIADDVIAVIAGMAATEVEGVDSMAGNITNEVVSKLGMKNLSKGVKICINEDIVRVNLTLNLKIGCKMADVCSKVQERVKAMIENMTGLHVKNVDVRVAGVEVHNV